MIGYKVLTKDMKAPVVKVVYNKDFQYSFNQRYHIEEGKLGPGECGFHFLSSLCEAIWYRYMLEKTHLQRFSKSIDLAIYEIDTLDGEIVIDDTTGVSGIISMKASSVIYINREITNGEIDNYFKKLNINSDLNYTIQFKSPNVINEGSNNKITIAFKVGPEYKECLDKIDATVVKDRLKYMQEHIKS